MKVHQRISEKDIRFGVVSDTHLCSDSEDLEHLIEMYNIFKSEGIRQVFHAGDITDGMGVYRGQENSLKVIGVDKQAEYTVNHYPLVSGITTYFITGNHDLKTFNDNGADVGGLIVNGGTAPAGSDETRVFRGRSDLKYLGRYYGRVAWNHILIDLVHPDAGFTYAVSYSPQKYINELEGGTKPNVLLYGHLHRALFMNYRNINLLMGGCFQGQIDFLKRKGISPVRGGWVVEMFKKNNREQFNPRFFRFF
jgi:predicted phosphodiesterase